MWLAIIFFLYGAQIPICLIPHSLPILEFIVWHLVGITPYCSGFANHFLKIGVAVIFRTTATVFVTTRILDSHCLIVTDLDSVLWSLVFV